MDFRELTLWVDSMEESDVNLIHMNGTQDEEAIMKAEKLEEAFAL